MEKYFEIENHDTFIKTITDSLKDNSNSIRKIEESANLTHGTLSRLTSSGRTRNKKYNMTSENIQKILNFFNFNPEEVGIKEITKTKFSIRLDTLLKENNMNQDALAKYLGVGCGTVSSWIKCRNEPPLTLVKKIATKFGVHYLYLLGEIDTKNIDNSTINEYIGLQDETINNIRNCFNINIYGKKQHDSIYKDFSFNYIDIVNFIANDQQFFDIFYLEATRVMTYYTSESYKDRFNNLFNTVELEMPDVELGIEDNSTFATTDYDTPYKVSIETYAKAILCEKIKRMFDKFINEKMKEKRIKPEL